MKNLYIILALISLFPLSVSAQDSSREDSICKNIVNGAQTDSLVLNSFSFSFYHSKDAIERNYDYELYNKQRKLRMWSNEVNVFAYVSVLGIAFGGAMLFPDASLWIAIPAEVVIMGGIFIGTEIWANNLRNKADAIQESSMSIIEIDYKYSLYVTHYSMNENYNLGLGIGYKYNF